MDLVNIDLAKASVAQWGVYRTRHIRRVLCKT